MSAHPVNRWAILSIAYSVATFLTVSTVGGGPAAFAFGLTAFSSALVGLARVVRERRATAR